MKRHTVLIALAVEFEGDYYRPDQLVDACHDWISAAFEDRDNLDCFTLTGTVLPQADDADAEPADDPDRTCSNCCWPSAGAGTLPLCRTCATAMGQR